MSNDFILGSMAGVLSTFILGLIIYVILKTDFNRLKLKNELKRKLNKFLEYTLEIGINLFINLFIWSSVMFHFNREVLNVAAFLTLIISISTALYITNRKGSISKKISSRLAFCFAANAGLYSFMIGIFCCFDGWNSKGNLLSYGSIFIGVGAFCMAFFIAFSQLIENETQKNDKSVKA